MRIRWGSIVLVAAVVILLPQPAEAGGSWLETERQYYTVGDHVVARGTFGRGSLEGRVSDGPFYAYLTPGDRDWEALPTEDAIHLGPMTIAEATGSYCCWVARVEFTVPDVTPGRYWIDYCNDPCTIDGIGDLIGGMIFVGETEREARLAARWERAKARVERMRERLDEAAAEIAALALRREAESTEEDREPNAAPQATRRVQEDRPVISIEGAALIAGAMLALLVGVVVRHRRPRQTSAGMHPMLPSAEDLLDEVGDLDGQDGGIGPRTSRGAVPEPRVPSLR